MSITGYGFIVGIRFDMPVRGAREMKVQSGNWRVRERASTGNLRSRARPEPTGSCGLWGFVAEPLEVGRGLPMVSRASRQDTELDAEVRGVRTNGTHWDSGSARLHI